MSEQRRLLESGFSYAETAERTNSYPALVQQRNQYIFAVDIEKAYRARIERDGIPNRLAISDAFGWWFSGYFDGEGCLVISFSTGNRGYGRRMGVQIACRNDDLHVLEKVRDTLGVGKIWPMAARDNAMAASAWRCENAKHLGEIIVPLFDRYPLQSKKGLEYQLWRPMACEQYIRSMGGLSRRAGSAQKGIEKFIETVVGIQKIRHPMPIDAAVISR